MRIERIWFGCKVILASVIVVSSVASISLGEGLICPVSGSNFQLNELCFVTRIEVSHSNYVPSGNVWLIDQSGNNYGPWNADISSGSWKVFPNQYLLSGSYRLVDSDPGTYQGQARIYGDPR